MKKVLLFITMAASLLFTQCKKEDSVPSAGRPVEMTVTVGPGSKTDIASTGGITWSENDKIYVGDGSKYVGYLTIASGVGSVTATFTGSVELTDADEGKELTFHFYYLGSADHTDLAKNATSVDVDFSSQDIIKGTDGKLTNASKQHVGYGSATGTVIGGAVTDINVMMVSKVAIAHFNFKKGDADYAGALTLGGTNICNKMTVNFNSEEFACEGTKGEISLTNTTTSEKYVMLVPTAETTGSQTLTFAGENVSGETTLENGIKPNKFYGLNSAIAVTLKAPSYLPGDFSVSANTKVKFSKGNLWYGKAEGEETAAFHFETNQWGTQPTSDGQWVSSHVSHFFWSNTTDWQAPDKEPYASEYSYSTQTTSDVFFTNSSSFQVAGETAGTWRTLTRDEWGYLLNSRDNASSLRAWKELDSGEHKGLVILPDGTDASVMSSISSTADLATYSAVFLPAAGARIGTYVTDVGGGGHYWSGTPYEGKAYRGYFSSNLVVSVDCVARDYGLAVRLVR